MTHTSVRFRSIIESLEAEVSRYYRERLVSLAVFGSVARGVATVESDLDFLIVANSLPRGRMNRIQEFMTMESGMLARRPDLAQVELSPIIKTPEEAELGSPLFWDMTDTVLILRDRDDFLANLLGRVRKRLTELGAHRVRRGDSWYWVLKGDYTPGEVFEL